VRQKEALKDQIAAAKKAFESCELEPTAAASKSIIEQLDEGVVLPEYRAYIAGAPTTSTIVCLTGRMYVSCVQEWQGFSAFEPRKQTVRGDQAAQE
jgi:hypothetical protein